MRANQVAMYGCTVEEIHDAVAHALSDPKMIALSMLSDAQEQIARGNAEAARQTINRAKFVIDLYTFCPQRCSNQLTQYLGVEIEDSEKGKNDRT